MFKKALVHHPDDYELTFNLANALRQNKDGEQAEVYYKKAVEIQPDVSNADINFIPGPLLSRKKLSCNGDLPKDVQKIVSRPTDCGPIQAVPCMSKQN